MRLAQLARKLALRPSEITEFLAAKQISVEDSSNAKVTDEHVILVLQHFAPELLEEAKSEIAPSVKMEAEEITEVKEELPAPSDITIEEEPASIGEIAEEKIEPIEVIKAPKVELPGLKVVGKIDLPEPKKKEEEKQPESEEQTVGQPEAVRDEQADRPPHRDRKQRGRRNTREQDDRRPRKNPIALQREREEREERRKREEQKEREKELRTRRYMEKVAKNLPPPKPVKKRKTEEEYEVYTEVTPPPKTIFGKIIRWLTST